MVETASTPTSTSKMKSPNKRTSRGRCDQHLRQLPPRRNGSSVRMGYTGPLRLRGRRVRRRFHARCRGSRLLLHQRRGRKRRRKRRRRTPRRSTSPRRTKRAVAVTPTTGVAGQQGRPAEERSTRRSRSPSRRHGHREPRSPPRSPVELRRTPGHNPYPEDMPSMNTGSSGSGNAGVSGALPTPVSPTHGPPDLGSALGPGDWVWVSSPGYWVFVPHEVPHQKGRHQSPGWEKAKKGATKGSGPSPRRAR